MDAPSESLPYTVQCCKANITDSTRLALDDETHDVRESMCLQRCGECYDTAFVVVDGAKVEYNADDPAGTLPDELIRRTEPR